MLLTLFVRSSSITILVAIAAELCFEPPAVAVAFFTALAPLIPGHVKVDAPVEGGLTPDGAYVTQVGYDPATSRPDRAHASLPAIPPREAVAGALRDCRCDRELRERRTPGHLTLVR